MKPLLILLLLFGFLYAKQLELDICAEGAILINAQTGAILYEKRAHERHFPASTTKIATAIYALHSLGDNFDKKMIATKECTASITSQAKKQSHYRSPPHWLETDGAHIGIKVGEEIPFQDLLKALLISSANDAANVIAHGVCGSIPRFMDELNRYLKEMGCLHTSFNNPHGLHHPDHLTTPYDLAQMAKAGLEHSLFAEIVSMVRYECPRTNLEYERTFLQTNLLLRPGAYCYSKAIGVKTGTTQAAGKNLVAAAEEKGRRLIAVMLGCHQGRAELYRDMINLFELAFNEPKMRRYLLKKGATDFAKKVKGAKKILKTTLPEGLTYDYYPSEECVVKAHVIWEIPPLPIQKNTVVGRIELTDEQGHIIGEKKLLAYEDLEPTLWFRCKSFFTSKAKAKNPSLSP